MDQPTYQETGISVLTADDHVIVRTGLQLLLELNFGISKIYEASSCAEVLSVLRQQQPSHMIIDMVFKDGNAMEIIPSITRLYPNLSILVYSMMPGDIYLPALQPYNIKYYISKDSSQDQMTDMLRTFLGGMEVPEALQINTNNPFEKLSPRELEVLHYLLEGKSVTTIGELLNIHKSTVSTLKTRLMEKATANNFTELIDKARIYGLKF